MAVVLFAAACGGPETPSAPPPGLTCPAPLTVQALNGLSATVTFAAPAVIGGAQPIQAASCSPPSGSEFPVGTSSVGCTVRDGEGRTAACGFTVTVTAPPQISASRFLAFGDSITEGKTGECPGGASPFDRFDPATFAAALQRLPNVPPGSDYPAALQTLLAGRYPIQTPAVTNRGLGGESAGEATTRDRLRKALEATNAEVLLLQEGINDLHTGSTDVVRSLQRMVQETQGRGVKVLIGTLLPERPGGCKAYALPPYRDAGTIERANDGIRAMAAAEGATLVDLYPVIAADMTTLLDQDGLHPTVAGYAKIAETFFEAVKQQFEVSGSP